MLVISVVIVSWIFGALSIAEHSVLGKSFVDAIKTALVINDELHQTSNLTQVLGWVPGDARSVEARRMVVQAPVPVAASAERFLMNGGPYQYIKYCPRFGCDAVEFDRAGRVIHPYPYRPQQFEKHQIVSFPYEDAWFRFMEDMHVFGVLKLPDNDLIITFMQSHAFPYGGGIARVRPDGSVVWFRHDYSEHWPKLLPDGNIVVPAVRIGGAHVFVPLADGKGINVTCNGKILEDIVRILSPDGQVQQEISVFDALLHSPYRGLLSDVPPCDPLHVNYVVPVTRGIRSLFSDVSPKDLVVSLRNLDAFAILGRRDHRLKHLFRGTFVRQHSVQPLGQSAKMLIFDDRGADWSSGPSRFLEYDLADHAEHNLLPKATIPGTDRFSTTEGDISVSPDLSRAIVTYSEAGRAYEVRLSDGKILTEFDNLQDMSAISKAHAGLLARFALHTATYTK